MRLALFVVVTGCGDDDSSITPDTQTGNHPPPRVIPGGGIGDGPIDGVVNLYVIDDATRAPISGATVRVGTLDGTTDSTGLFIADGLVGPQNVIVKASGLRSEMWLGANGANMTMSLRAATDPVPTKANLSGSITGFDAITVPTGHRKAAWVSYSQDEKAGDAANDITTPNGTNICSVLGSGGCNFTITTRTGQVGLIAAILDHDTKNTINDADDTFTLIGWASRTGITVQNGVNQAAVDLTLVDVGNLTNVTVDFGTPPTGMPNVAAVVGIDVGASGTLQLIPQFLTPTKTSVLAPKLDAFPGATYRLTGIANNGNTATSATSIVLKRGLTATTLVAGMWLGLASSLTITRTGASWTPVPAAIVQGVEYDVDKTNHLLSVTALDGSSSFTIPDLIALPASGALLGKSIAMQGTLDLASFSLETDLAKVTGFSAQPVQID